MLYFLFSSITAYVLPVFTDSIIACWIEFGMESGVPDGPTGWPGSGITFGNFVGLAD